MVLIIQVYFCIQNKKNKTTKIRKTKKEVKDMNDLKENIKKELEILENMISLNKEKEKIENQRKKLDKLLEEYLKDLD